MRTPRARVDYLKGKEGNAKWRRIWKDLAGKDTNGS